MDNDLPPPNPLEAKRERRVQLSVRLPLSMWSRLDALAKTSGAKASDLIEQAVRYYFAALDRNHQRRK